MAYLTVEAARAMGERHAAGDRERVERGGPVAQHSLDMERVRHEKWITTLETWEREGNPAEILAGERAYGRARWGID
jgi:hypothetical protein